MADEQNSMDSPEDRGPMVLAVNAACLGCTILFVSLRLYTKISMKALGTDDVLICLSALCGIGLSVTGIFALKYGMGRHVGTISSEELIMYTKVTWISGLFYCASIAFVKASLLALYLHLSPRRTYRSLSYILLVLVVGHIISSLTVIIFQCTPVPYLWDKTMKGRCIQTKIFYFANAGLNILTDVLIYLLPMPILWGIQLPKRQKVGLCAIFSLGALACAASIVHLLYLPELLDSQDPTWTIVDSFNWSIIELHAAIFAACISSLKILIKRHFPNLLGTSYHYSHSAPSGVRMKTKLGRHPHHRAGHHMPYALGSMDTREHTTNHIEGGGGVSGGAGGLGDRDRDDGGGMTTVGGDGESEILFIEVPDGGIIKTTEVEVRVVERG
ncbi:hypothetical protein L873DRAFT_1837050 [Choiromyces venosus 120613-1]|uniref:Rhodopsin domain-containing protein n=1 Tax=Choiromyces venosus 120613-1 TaxID=1336337 RepID=A0A3N4JGH5_9PEZI|nr:hypothetical protein L873DRAFT_1837050 [Choiromyces venosus 120613-1]